MNKAGKTPLVPRTGQSKSAELVEKCPLTTRRLVKRMQRRLQESEVADVRRLISHVASMAEQGSRCNERNGPASPSKQRLTDVSGARGVAAPVPRMGQCRHEYSEKTSRDGTPRTQERKERTHRSRKRATTAGKSGPTAGKKSMANCRRSGGKQPSVKETGNNHELYQDPPDTVRRNARTGPRQFRQRPKLGSSGVAVHRPGDPCLDAEAARIQLLSCSTSMRRPASLPRAQKTAPPDQSNEKRVDDTVIMQTSSNSPS